MPTMILNHRCEACLGTGYTGCWDDRSNGRPKWRIRCCQACNGRGVKDYKYRVRGCNCPQCVPEAEDAKP